MLVQSACRHNLVGCRSVAHKANPAAFSSGKQTHGTRVTIHLWPAELKSLDAMSGVQSTRDVSGMSAGTRYHLHTALEVPDSVI